MTPDERLRLSKTLTYILRHRPWEFELELDPEGFVPVGQLLEALSRGISWLRPTRAHLEEVLANSDKERFELREERIRARYGHSVPYRLQYEPKVPPAELWHGTSRRAAETIRSQGLRPMGRQYVHLSTAPDTARIVGLRHDPRPVIFRVRALDASRSGSRFFQGNDLIWLADAVAPDFLETT